MFGRDGLLAAHRIRRHRTLIVEVALVGSGTYRAFGGGNAIRNSDPPGLLSLAEDFGARLR
ncbi:MAG: hypothetical protein NZ899_05835 [Thermoguttaceae bacterium]|nr:hypothetical protein [Thermoguttaceae bacterium]MDW8079461.1 hypothetical protein [Thermoguttaceae bacterium]